MLKLRTFTKFFSLHGFRSLKTASFIPTCVSLNSTFSARSFSTQGAFDKFSEDKFQVKKYLGQANEQNQADNVVGALENYRKALAILHKMTNYPNQNKLSSEEVRVMAEIHLSKGSIFYLNKNLEEALDNFQKARKYFLESNGETKIVAECDEHIGTLYLELGNHAKAIESFLGAAKIYQSNAIESPLAKIYQELSLAYTLMENQEEALLALKKSLELQLKLGQEHCEDTAYTYMHIGEALNNQQRYSEALQVLQEALKIKIQIFGMNHIETSNCYSKLGKTYEAIDEIEKATKSFAKSLQLKKRILGKHDVGLVEEYINLGDLHCKNENWEQALIYYQKGLKISKKNSRLCTSRSYLCYKIGGIYLNLKEMNAAMKMLEEGLELRVKNCVNQEGPCPFDFYELLGVASFESQNYFQSYQYYLKALELCETGFGRPGQETSQLFIALASLDAIMKNYDQARINYEKALERQTKELGENHCNQGYTYHGLGTVYFRQNKIDEAIENYRKALQLISIGFGSESQYLASLYADLGSALKKKGQLEEAIQSYEEGMKIVMYNFGVGHHEVQRFLKELKELYKKQGKFEQLSKLENFLGDAIRQ